MRPSSAHGGGHSAVYAASSRGHDAGSSGPQHVSDMKRYGERQLKLAARRLCGAAVLWDTSALTGAKCKDCKLCLLSPAAACLIRLQHSLTSALNTAHAGSGEVRAILQASPFKPRLPGLTKVVSQLTREGQWAKGVEVFEALDAMGTGVRADTTITNAAISACCAGGQWEKALAIFNR